MKIKLDFITNSSSAAVCLIIKSDHKTVEEFKEMFNKYIEEYENGAWGKSMDMHFWDGSAITKVATGVFKVCDWTSMYNYAMCDIPHYMQTLYLNWSVDPTGIDRQFRFKKIKIEVDKD